MRRLLWIALASVCGVVACNVNALKGPCTSDSNCGAGSVCEGGYCVSHQCRPACNSSQTCDTQTVTCHDVTVPSINVTSPGASSFAGLTLQASATARAPGGVSGLTFEVQSTGGAVLASASGIPASQGSSDFTATIPLNGAGIAEGPAVFVTRITYQTTQTFSAAPVAFQIDKTPPTISMGTYDGRTAPFVGPGNATGTVTAVITDTASGVDTAEVKLTLIGGDGGTFVGTPGTGGVYTFAVPRTSLNTTDGFVGPISFKIDAKDLVKNAAPTLTGDPTQVIRIDNAKPSVSIAADTTWYAATAGMVTVSTTISDPSTESGLVATGNARPFLKIGAASPVFGTQGAGTTWTFSFDPSVQPSNTEGPVQFTVTAQDVAGNVQVATGSRNVDNKAPTISSLEVFLSGAPDPGQQGVTYPSQPASAVNGLLSGRDGSHFIFSDSVHIKGNFSDGGAGLSGASLKYRLDGVAQNGSAVAGAEQTLGAACTDGSSSCSFDVPSVALNDLTRITSFNASTANLTLVFLAEDTAHTATGGPAHNVAAPIMTPIATTRLWWSRQFSVPTGTVSVSGIAIHPNGDVIAGNNTSAAVETLYALFRDGPFNASATPTRSERWKKVVGGLVAAPVVGPASANVYVASNTLQKIFAVKSDGSDLWSSGSLAVFVSTPAVVPNQQINTTAGCEAVVSAGGSGVHAACQDPGTLTAATTTSISVTDTIVDSPITFAGGNIFVGTAQRVARTSFDGTGFLTTAVRFPATDAGQFGGVASSPNGAALFAATTLTHSAYSFTFSMAAFSTVWGPVDTGGAVGAATQGHPILSSTGVLLDTSDSILHSLVLATGTNSTLATLASPGYTPLLGADGNIYVGRNGAIQALSGTGGALWSMAVPANATAAPNLDCNGVLYAAAADTVYALITDMVSTPSSAGLANATSSWPKYQRDSRNSGNADATVKWGIRTNATTCVQ